MDYKSAVLKTTVSAVMAALGRLWGMISTPFLALCLLMATDYCTGLVKSKHMGNICSRTGIKGIVKKLCYGGAVIAAAGVDYTVMYLAETFGKDAGFGGFFALTVTFWLIINECISILENLSAIGVPMPGFLTKAASYLKTNIEKKGQERDER